MSKVWSNMALSRYFGILLLSVLIGVCNTDSAMVKNITVFEEEDINLKCDPSGFMDKYIKFVLKDEVIYRSDEPELINVAHYKASKSPNGVITLIIMRATFGDSAIYKCINLGDESVLARYNVVVLGFPKVRTDGTHLEGRELTSRCVLEFQSPHRKICTNNTGGVEAWCPHLSLSYKDKNNTNFHYVCQEPIGYEVSMLCTAEVIHHEIAHRDDDGKVRRCIGTTPSERRMSDPSEQVVKYPVSTPEIKPSKASYLVGDDITCNATGNPPPTIIWENGYTKQEIKCQKLHVKRTMVGKNNWTCIAMNEPEVRIYHERLSLTFEVEETSHSTPTKEDKSPPTSGRDPWMHLTFGTWVVFLVVIIVVIVIKLKGCKWKSLCSSKTTQDTVEEQENCYREDPGGNENITVNKSLLNGTEKETAT